MLRGWGAGGGGGQGSEKIMDPKTEKDSTFIVLVFVQEKK